MSLQADLVMLFERDLKRLHQEIADFPSEDLLWATLPGITNSAGHLATHLEGNLREFIGLKLGGIPYTRDRPREFTGPPVPQAELLTRIESLTAALPPVLQSLSQEQLETEYPQPLAGRPSSTAATLIHLHGHLTWHLGHINYLRRILSASVVAASL